MDSEIQLSCSYHDDDGRVQGPFDATAVLNWYLKGFFRDYHLMRFTDNGMSIGSRVTYETTVGELRRTFGDENAIPTTLKMLNDVGICGFVVKPPAKPVFVAKPEERREIKRDVAGPMLPPEMQENEHSRKTRTASNSSSLNSTNFKTEKRHGEEYLPFYGGSKKEPDDFMHKLVAIELGSFLQKQYIALARDVRKSVHDACSKNWALPDKCKVCHVAISPIPNFLSHVVSETHIRKSMENGGLKFSFEKDYMPLKRLFAVKSSIPNARPPKKSKPQNVTNAPPSKKSRSQRRAERRRAASPLRSDLQNGCTTS